MHVKKTYHIVWSNQVIGELADRFTIQRHRPLIAAPKDGRYCSLSERRTEITVFAVCCDKIFLKCFPAVCVWV